MGQNLLGFLCWESESYIDSYYVDWSGLWKKEIVIDVSALECISWNTLFFKTRRQVSLSLCWLEVISDNFYWCQGHFWWGISMPRSFPPRDFDAKIITSRFMNSRRFVWVSIDIVHVKSLNLISLCTWLMCFYVIHLLL